MNAFDFSRPPHVVVRATLPHGFVGHPAHDMLERCWGGRFVEYNGLGDVCHFFYAFDALTPLDVAVLSHVSMAGADVLVIDCQTYQERYTYRGGENYGE